MPHKRFRRLTPKLRKRAIYGRTRAKSRNIGVMLTLHRLAVQHYLWPQATTLFEEDTFVGGKFKIVIFIFSAIVEKIKIFGTNSAYFDPAKLSKPNHLQKT
jgi:hypothetical protein